MFDYHYDLLTNVYINRNNLNSLKRYYAKIYNKNNITGGIFNLFFMSENEMEEELGIQRKELNLKQMLDTVDELIKTNEIIPKGINYVYGIEGLDYLENIKDVEYLHKKGVRSTNIVWNNENKFGSGVKGNKNNGLTSLGYKLINELVKYNIAIDLSHANEKTFFNITDYLFYLKDKGKNIKVIASHSNAKKLCNVERNLTDEQLLTIKRLNGIVGVVEIKRFCKEGDLKNIGKSDYINQVEYIANLFGGYENIRFASDDMSYYPTNKEYYKNENIFKFEEVGKEMKGVCKFL